MLLSGSLAFFIINIAEKKFDGAILSYSLVLSLVACPFLLHVTLLAFLPNISDVFKVVLLLLYAVVPFLFLKTCTDYSFKRMLAYSATIMFSVLITSISIITLV
jgi:hypothetical protein